MVNTDGSVNHCGLDVLSLFFPQACAFEGMLCKSRRRRHMCGWLNFLLNLLIFCSLWRLALQELRPTFWNLVWISNGVLKKHIYFQNYIVLTLGINVSSHFVFLAGVELHPWMFSSLWMNISISSSQNWHFLFVFKLVGSFLHPVYN